MGNVNRGSSPSGHPIAVATWHAEQAAKAAEVVVKPVPKKKAKRKPRVKVKAK